MRDQPNPADRDELRPQRHILHLLIYQPHHGPLSVEELVRAHGNEAEAADAIAALHATGLVHLNDGYAWATLAATHAVALEEHD
jgi:hypothetical protein